jgi:hypothetical protein
MNLRREERIERTSTQMEVLHQTEQPRPLITTRLPQSLHHTNWLHGVANAVALHPCVCHLAFMRLEPGCCQGCVGKHEKAPYGY